MIALAVVLILVATVCLVVLSLCMSAARGDRADAIRRETLRERARVQQRRTDGWS